VPQNHETLTLSGDEMRRLGYLVVDHVVTHFEQLPQMPVTRIGDRHQLESIFSESLPPDGQSLEPLLASLAQDAFANMMHLDSPRFFAYVPSPSNFIGVLASLLVAGFNPFAGTWLEASGPAQIEMVTIGWLLELFGLSKQGGGLFVGGGSTANLTALLLARETRLNGELSRGIVYCSDQTHSSVERAAKLIGLKTHQLRKIPVSASFQIQLSELVAFIEADKANGLLPFCLIGNAGTTNTGAIDDLAALAELATHHGLWFHVDAAYGGAAVLCKRGKRALAQIHRADSIAFDPHKWLFQPYECAVLLVKDSAVLRNCFHILPEYLTETARDKAEINYCEYGIQLTRDFKALKVWLSIKFWGADAIGSAIQAGLEQAEFAEEIIRHCQALEVVTPAQMGIICFGVRPNTASRKTASEMNRSVVERVIRNGLAMISTTVLRGQTVLRMCTINPRTSQDDLVRTLKLVEEYALIENGIS